jgi:hypothetical protein
MKSSIARNILVVAIFAAIARAAASVLKGFDCDTTVGADEKKFMSRTFSPQINAR